MVSVKMAPPPGLVTEPHPGVTGDPLRRLMNTLDHWENARSIIDYFEYYSWILDLRFTDSELSQYFSEINSWDCKFCLEVACLRDDAGYFTAKEALFWKMPRWERFIELGAEIDVFTIDESYTCCRRGSMGSDEYAVKETALWIYIVRTQFDPDVEICSIESFPYYFNSDINELIWWLDELEAECNALGVKGIQSFSLDVDWNMAVSWEDIAALEDSCQARGISFEMIYWPARHTLSNHEDVHFYKDIHDQGAAYQAAGGTPDVYTIQSWTYIPRQMVPESEQWSFTYSFNSFVRSFVPK